MLICSLAVYFQMLFKGFPDECDALKILKNGALETSSSTRWATEWEEHAKPLINKARLVPFLFDYCPKVWSTLQQK
ncbi:hypothetical protein Ahy_A03g015420 isoform D [Arachis hypogaea]|uniref:Uncharacterized protein n=1 Tax=Arachis hypogaea TaxID=3818 RepID=A0A445E0C4_ARAHY|nr:hypothetical protein Ahy_A03g015420 isoform D [Arachis hypogaea]